MVYQALFDPAAEGGFVVTFPDLGKGATQGDTEDDAMEMAEDFLLCAIDLYIRSGEQIPPARRYRGKKYRSVQLPAMAGMKAELYRAFRASGIRKAEFARRLGIPKGIVDRLFEMKHNTRLGQIEAAFHAVGKRMSVEVRDAA